MSRSGRCVLLVMSMCLTSIQETSIRFLRLPGSYSLKASGPPLLQLNAASVKECGVRAIIEEVASSNVSYYSYDATVQPSCIIYADGTIQREGADGATYYMKWPKDKRYSDVCPTESEFDDLVQSSTVTTTTTPTITKTTPNPTTQTSTRRMTTTPKPIPCEPSAKGKQAGVILDNGAPPTLIAQAKGKQKSPNVVCQCSNGATSIGSKQWWGMQTSIVPWQINEQQMNVVSVSCTTKANLCVCDEAGACFKPGRVPPDYLTLQPQCDKTGACHMYVIQNTDVFYKDPPGPGSSLVYGRTTITEKNQFTADYNEYKNISTYSPTVYIQAGAISCRGCTFIEGYKTQAACSIPPAKG